MTPKEKAKELVDKFKDYVHGYIGSSMLTNHEYPEQILAQAKKVAIISVDVILKSEPRRPSNVDWDDVGGTHQYYYEAQREDANNYWQEVKKEIEAL